MVVRHGDETTASVIKVESVFQAQRLIFLALFGYIPPV